MLFQKCLKHVHVSRLQEEILNNIYKELQRMWSTKNFTFCNKSWISFQVYNINITSCSAYLIVARFHVSTRKYTYGKNCCKIFASISEDRCIPLIEYNMLTIFITNLTRIRWIKFDANWANLTRWIKFVNLVCSL